VKELKEHDLSREFDVLLRDLLARVPFLELLDLKTENSLPSGGSNGRPDRLAEIRAKGRRWTLAVEFRRHGHPRDVRIAALQLKHFLEQSPGR